MASMPEVRWPPPVKQMVLEINLKHFIEAELLDSQPVDDVVWALYTDLKVLATEPISKHANTLKNMGSKLCECTGNPILKRHYTFFINFFFDVFVQTLGGSPETKPCNKIIMKLFQNLPVAEHDQMAIRISIAIQEFCQTDIDKLMALSDTAVDSLDLIANCYDSDFKIGFAAICIHRHQILEYLAYRLSYTVLAYMEESRVMQAILRRYLHSLIQVILMTLQRFPTIASQMVLEYKALMIDHILLSLARYLCVKDMKSETMNNGAFIVVLLVGQLYGEIGLVQLLRGTQTIRLLKFCPEFYSSETRVSICSGLLNALTFVQHFSVIPLTKLTMMEHIFLELLHLGKMNVAKADFTLNVNRALTLGFRKLLIHVTKPENVAILLLWQIVERIALQALPYMWETLECKEDNTRHAGRETFESIAAIGGALKGSNLVPSIMNDLSSIAVNHKSRFVSLKVLGKAIGCVYLLSQIPDLVSSMINAIKEVSLRNAVEGAFKQLLEVSYQEMSIPQWTTTWIYPIGDAFSSAERGDSGLEKVLEYAVSLSPTCLTSINPQPGRSIPLAVQLAMAKIAKQQMLRNKKAAKGTEWGYVITCETLEQCLRHGEAKIRLRALQLIVDTPKTSSLFTSKELELVLNSIDYNVNSEDTGATQQFIGVMKQMILRLASGFRDEMHSKSLPNAGGDGRVWKLTIFVNAVVEKCLLCFYPGANLSRRTTGIKIISMIFENLPMGDKNPVLCNKTAANILFKLLMDPYESIKTMAHKLLIRIPSDCFNFETTNDLEIITKVALSLASSNRPPNCVTAAYVLRTICVYEESVVHFTSDPVPAHFTIFPMQYFAILKLTNHLRRELAVAKYSILLAATHCPMYGTLSCIRLLMQDIDHKELTKSVEWLNLITELIDISFEMMAVVTQVVNNSSPEGHLPMDLVTAQSVMNVPMASGSDDPGLPLQLHGVGPLAAESGPVTSQMVLLCGWRTAKEAALFLGHVAEKAQFSTSPNENDTSFLLPVDKLVMMGLKLSELMYETKHRGAFEQTYIGFTQVCARLWASDDEVYSEIPRTWLQDALNTVEAGEGLIVTRRGAGLPFIIQALIVTEGSHLRTSLHFAMKKLIPLALEAHSEAVSVVSANILRTLFRHNVLGAAISDYIINGMLIALRGFKSSSFAVRNSATLLFSTMITRIFGVPRHKETLSSKDRLSVSAFFARYPDLKQILLNELAAPEDSGKPDSKYPTLLLLARLYPSATEESRTYIQDEFLPLVHKCGYSPVLTTRILAAKAHAVLITPKNLGNVISGLLYHAINLRKQNSKHGCLLQVQYLLDEQPQDVIKNEVTKLMAESWIVTCFQIFRNNPYNWTIQHANTLVLQCLLKCFNPFLSQLECNNVATSVFYVMHQAGVFTDYPIDGFPGESANASMLAEVALNVVLALPLSPEQIHFTFIAVLGTSSLEVGLQFLVTLFTPSHRRSEQDVNFVRGMNPRVRVHLMNLFVHGYELTVMLFALIRTPNIHMNIMFKVYRILALMPPILMKLGDNRDNIVVYLLGRCNVEAELVVSALIECISSVISRGGPSGLSHEVWLDVARLLTTNSAVDKPDQCRRAIAQLFRANPVLLTWGEWNLRACCAVPMLARCMMQLIAMRFHLDDDLEVRHVMCKIASPHLPCIPQRALALYLEKFAADGGGFLVEKAVILTALALHNNGPSIHTDIEQCIFEEDEANYYAEDIAYTSMACKVLTTQLRILGDVRSKELLYNTIVDPSLMFWLVAGCLPVAQQAPMPNTINEFVSQVCSPAAQGSCANNAPDALIQCLTPRKKTKEINVCKMRKVIEALSM